MDDTSNDPLPEQDLSVVRLGQDERAVDLPGPTRSELVDEACSVVTELLDRKRQLGGAGQDFLDTIVTALVSESIKPRTSTTPSTTALKSWLRSASEFNADLLSGPSVPLYKFIHAVLTELEVRLDDWDLIVEVFTNVLSHMHLGLPDVGTVWNLGVLGGGYPALRELFRAAGIADWNAMVRGRGLDLRALDHMATTFSSAPVVYSIAEMTRNVGSGRLAGLFFNDELTGCLSHAWSIGYRKNTVQASSIGQEDIEYLQYHMECFDQKLKSLRSLLEVECLRSGCFRSPTGLRAYISAILDLLTMVYDYPELVQPLIKVLVWLIPFCANWVAIFQSTYMKDIMDDVCRIFPHLRLLTNPRAEHVRQFSLSLRHICVRNIRRSLGFQLAPKTSELPISTKAKKFVVADFFKVSDNFIAYLSVKDNAYAAPVMSMDEMLDLVERIHELYLLEEDVTDNSVA